MTTGTRVNRSLVKLQIHEPLIDGDGWTCGFTAPVIVVSEANQRGHWRKKHVRKNEQQVCTASCLRALSMKPPKMSAVGVTLVRLGPRLLDTDNLHGAFKHVRDTIGKWLGTGDAPGNGVEWDCLQVKQRDRGIMVSISGRIA